MNQSRIKNKNKSKHPILYRQGDILLKKTSLEYISNLKKIESNIIREGELTGHQHALVGGNIQIFEKTDTKTKYVEVFEPSVLTHQEHGPLNIEVGQYVVIIEREHDLFQAMMDDPVFQNKNVYD